MLVTGANLDDQALAAAVGRAVPGASVTFRSAVLAALARAPLPHMATVFFAEGVVLSAALAGVILLLGLATGARARDRALARLRVLGLGRGQGRLLLATEALPPVLAAMAGGLACAWLLGPLIGPALNLSVFTGSAAGVAVRPGFAALAWPAAVLLGLAAAALAVQAGLAARRSPAAAAAGRRMKMITRTLREVAVMTAGPLGIQPAAGLAGLTAETEAVAAAGGRPRRRHPGYLRPAGPDLRC